MTDMEKKIVARNATIDLLREVLEKNEAVQFADGSFAILEMVGEDEIWTEVCVKSKAFKPTQRSAIFDPYEVAEDWKDEKARKAKKAAEKAAEKAKKVKKEEDE